jgi:hypothetical protein
MSTKGQQQQPSPSPTATPNPNPNGNGYSNANPLSPDLYSRPSGENAYYGSQDFDDDERRTSVGFCNSLALLCLSITQCLRETAACYIFYLGLFLSPWSEGSAFLSFISFILCVFGLFYDRDASCDRPIREFLIVFVVLCLVCFSLYVARSIGEARFRAKLDRFFETKGPLFVGVFVLYVVLVGVVGGAICLFSSWDCMDNSAVSYYVLLIVWVEATTAVALVLLSGILWFCSGLPEDAHDIDELASKSAAASR